MSEVTFTPEQVREIRDRLNDAHTKAACDESITTTEHFRGVDTMRDRAVAAFPLPNVTRYRTFTVSWGGGKPDTYRVHGPAVQWFNAEDGEWEYSRTRTEMAKGLASAGDWTALAAFADICARPTEEVDA